MSAYIQPFFVVESWLFPLKVLKDAQHFTPFHKNPTTNSTGFDTFKKEHLRPLRIAASNSREIPDKGHQEFGVGNEWERCFGKQTSRYFVLQTDCLLDLLNFLDGYMAGKKIFVMNVFLLRKDCFRHDLGKGGLRWWNFFLQPFVWNSVCDTVDGWNPAPPGMRNPIYSINNRINYLSTGARFQPST